MKKIGALLLMLLFDILILNISASADMGTRLIQEPFFAFLLLLATLMVTLILFYEDHVHKLHQEFFRIRKEEAEVMTGVHETKQEVKPGKNGNISLDMQYEFIDLVRQQIIEMKTSGKSDAEIINALKEEKWDPQVIYIALGRVKKGK